MNFGDYLIGIVAQRLARALCKHYAHPSVPSPDALQALVQEYVEGTTPSIEEGSRRLLATAGTDNEASAIRIYRPLGCERCNGRGYRRRMGIYDLLENVGDMKRKIQTPALTSEIFAEASRAGILTLRQDALEKVAAGSIDIAQSRTVY
jgi:type II secretory ATPase GspE/PulE/Tfp pilus assembly ATPase PilB-like protein